MKILNIQNGLRTKFNASNIRFKKTFKEAEKLGVDLNDATEVVKKDGQYQKVVFVSGFRSKHLGGRYCEKIYLLPIMQIKYD